MNKRMTDRQVDDHKITAYQRLVRALAAERQTIREFGVFSYEALEADKHTVNARKDYELWRKK